MNPFEELYDRYDRWYEKPFGSSAFGLEVLCLKKLIKGRGKFLEVGVGTGRFASALGIEYGLDPSLNMLKLAKERGIKVVQGRGESLPFRSESFDGVFLIVTLCFVENPSSVLREAHRVLKAGGSLYLGLVLRESRWSAYYEKKGKEGNPFYSRARFYSFLDLKELTKGLFIFEKMYSTLLEEPQDREPVKNREVLPGFSELSGFTCIRMEKR